MNPVLDIEGMAPAVIAHAEDYIRMLRSCPQSSRLRERMARDEAIHHQHKIIFVAQAALALAQKLGVCGTGGEA